jgi:ribosomal protein S27AE
MRCPKCGNEVLWADYASTTGGFKITEGCGACGWSQEREPPKEEYVITGSGGRFWLERAGKRPDPMIPDREWPED